MIFRWLGASKSKVTHRQKKARLRLEQLEDRCVPSATDLGVASDFNAFIFTDFTGSNSDVEGRLAVGRDANLKSYGIGDKLSNSHGTRNDLIVGDDLTYTYGQVFNGNILYASTAKLTGVGLPNGKAQKGTALDFTAAQTDLLAKSAKWGGDGTTGTITNNWGGLVLKGTDPQINVFNLSAAQLQNIWGLTIDAPKNSTVLVNVTGTNVTMQNFGLNVTGTDPSRVLFNFYQATTVNLQGISFQANILAPKATVNFNNGNVFGTVVAKSFTGSGQLNLSPIHINIPEFIPANISGTVFLDKNKDGLQQSGEPGIAQVFIILQGNGVSFSLSTTTDANGHFSFHIPQPGSYTVAAIVVDPYVLVSLHVGTIGGNPSLTTGEIQDIPVKSGSNGLDYDFGLFIPSDNGGGERPH